MLPITMAVHAERPRLLLVHFVGFFVRTFFAAKLALSRPSTSRKQCGPCGVERNGPDNPSITAVSETAAKHAFVGAQVCVPVADVERERFPVVGDTGGPSELLEGIRIFEELVPGAGI